MLGGGGSAFLRMLTTLPLRSFSSSVSSLQAALSTPAIISTYGILRGAGAKLSPRCKTCSSVLDSSLEDRFTTRLLSSMHCRRCSCAARRRSIKRSNFRTCSCCTSRKVLSLSLENLRDFLKILISKLLCQFRPIFLVLAM